MECERALQARLTGSASPLSVHAAVRDQRSLALAQREA